MPVQFLRDRRAAFDRRIGERRQRAVPVSFERRRGADRRRNLERREGPGGHVRNAIQILKTLMAIETLEPDARDMVEAAVERLQLGLRELDRLRANRHSLGTRLRRHRPDEPAGD